MKNAVDAHNEEIRKIRRQVLREGHGRTDVSCRHGSRWIWWRDNMVNPDGSWMQVVLAPDCNCSDPPRPFKEQVTGFVGKSRTIRLHLRPDGSRELRGPARVITDQEG